MIKYFIILFLTAITIPKLSIGQTKVYKNLVLEGGGMRGLAYSGALEVLDSAGFLKTIERVGGTSAGAIQATLLAIGYTPKEMTEAIKNIPFRKLNDGFAPTAILRMKNKFGLFKGKKLNNWLDELIAFKTGNANITFQQLQDQKNEKKYKDLYITGTDLMQRKLIVFSHENFPDMQIKVAMRISFSIPLFYEPIYMNDKGTLVSRYAQDANHFMVDGGLLANYPIELFDSTKYINSNEVNVTAVNPETLGFLLDKPEFTNYSKKQIPLEINNLKQYLSAVYQTVIDKPNPENTSSNRTLLISHLNLSGRPRKLSNKTIQSLLESGREGARNFIHK